MTTRAKIPVADRFWSKVDTSSDCWVWQAYCGPNGYGQFMPERGRATRAHRFAYELLVRPLAPGEILDHACHDPATCSGGVECRHRACVNPAHLRVTSYEGNLAPDRIASFYGSRDHCSRGHLYTEETLVWRHKKGKKFSYRDCRLCVHIREKNNRKGKVK